jgi:hypothetical protein
LRRTSRIEIKMSSLCIVVTFYYDRSKSLLFLIYTKIVKWHFFLENGLLLYIQTM